MIECGGVVIPLGKRQRRKKDICVPPHERNKPKDSKGGLLEDMLSSIRNRVEGSDNIFKEMKEAVMTFSHIVTSNPVSIKQFKTKMGHISALLNLRQHRGFPRYTISNLKNEV